MAWASHDRRLNEFGQEGDPVKKEYVNKLCDRARITGIEHDLAIACVQSLSQPEAAKVAANRNLEMMGKAEIPSTSIHSGLWGFVATVLKGGKLQG